MGAAITTKWAGTDGDAALSGQAIQGIANQWGNIPNWIANRNDSFPQPNNMGFQFGANSAQPPSQPSGFSSFMQGAAPGIGMALTSFKATSNQ